MEGNPKPDPAPVEKVQEAVEECARVADMLSAHLRDHAAKEEWPQIQFHFKEILEYYSMRYNELLAWQQGMEVRRQYPYGARVWREDDGNNQVLAGYVPSPN